MDSIPPRSNHEWNSGLANARRETAIFLCFIIIRGVTAAGRPWHGAHICTREVSFYALFFFPLATASCALVRCSLRRWGVFLRRGWSFALFCVTSSYLLAVACAHTDTATETQGFQLVRVSLRVVPVKRALFIYFLFSSVYVFFLLCLAMGGEGLLTLYTRYVMMRFLHRRDCFSRGQRRVSLVPAKKKVVPTLPRLLSTTAFAHGEQKTKGRCMNS